MEIAGYIKTSLIEWPGKISSVIFVQGCNFKCPFCHNADLVLGQGFSPIPEKRIFADLDSRKGWIDAVVVTGGEPTLQKDLLKFLKLLKELKLLIAIHTNGSNPEVLKKLLEEKLLDFIAMDLKGNFEDYDKYTNVQCTIYNVQKSMELIIKSGVEYEFRTTVVPTLHNKENLIKLANQIGSASAKASADKRKWFLQQFRPLNCLDKSFIKIKPYSKEQMEGFCRALQEIIPQTSLRGV